MNRAASRAERRVGRSPAEQAARAAPAEIRELPALRRALLAHYDRHRRALPWRDEADPYRVLVSEVMLQQTRVETVTRYYGSWVERFPDLLSLAEAEEGEVLKAWEGLGYYRRARNLHRTARAVREHHGGSLPTTYAELRTLPGLGDYTAGAVASIAFAEPVPAVDGNVRRVLARLFDVAAPRAGWLRTTAARMVDRDRPGDWNQALMELGATVCTPRAPRCASCPVSRWCAARAAGTVAVRPGGAPRSDPRRALFALAVLRSGGRVLLERRPVGGLLGGLWAFPEREIDAEGDASTAVAALVGTLGLRARGTERPLPTFEHRFTHLHATYAPRAWTVQSDPSASEGRPDTDEARPLAWVVPGEPTELPMPIAQKRLLARLADGGLAEIPAEGARR